MFGSKHLKSFSLEDEATGAVAAEVVDESVKTDSEEAAVAQTNADLQELEEAVETSEDAVAGLEQVQEFVEQKQEENGGLTEGEAEIVQVATEALLSRFHGAIKVRVPSLESFGRSKATSTSYTLESIGETIKSIWEAIKKWVKKWWEKVYDWFMMHFSFAGRAKKQAVALREKLNSKFGTPEDTTFELPGSVRRWLVTQPGQKQAQVNVLEKYLGFIYSDKSVKEIKDLNKDIAKAIESINPDDMIKKGLEGKKNVTAHHSTSGTSVTDALATDLGNRSALFGVKSTIDSKLKEFYNSTASSTPTLGAVFLKVNVNKMPMPGTTSNQEIILSYSLDFTDVTTSSNEFGEERDIDTLKRDDILKSLNAIEGIAEFLIKQEKIFKQEREENKKLMEKIEKIANRFDKVDVEIQKDPLVKSVTIIIKNSNKCLTANENGHRKLIDHTANVIKNWLSFCSKCINNLTDQKA